MTPFRKTTSRGATRTRRTMRSLSIVADDDETWQADVGEPELDVTDGESSGPDADGPTDAPGEHDGDVEIADDLPSSEDDSGEEGTTDPIEHSLDEELPALDADDEGDF